MSNPQPASPEERIQKLEGQLDSFNRRLEALEKRARERNDKSQPVSSPAPAQRVATLGRELRRLNESEAVQGFARLLAQRLLAHLQELEAFGMRLGTDDVPDWVDETTLDELQAVLFRPPIEARWEEVRPQDAPPLEREALRALETAVCLYRQHLQGELKARFGVAPVDVVPYQTRFDAAFHQTSDYYSHPARQVSDHNLIFGIERIGFLLSESPEAAPRLLRRSLVKRFVWEVDPTLATRPNLPDPENEAFVVTDMSETSPRLTDQ